MAKIRKVFNRLGCLLIFIIWLFVMAMPCTLVTLLVNKELVYHRSDLPEHQIRLFLLDSPDERGFGLSWGSIQSGGEDEGQYCILTSVDYLMWEGKGLATDYCDCYEKIEGQWSPTLVGGDKQCNPTQLPLE